MVFFAAAHREWRPSIRNDTGTPYGDAHNATAHPDDGYLQQETVDTIANLATAKASDRAAISQITSTVERLTEDLVKVNVTLVTSLQTQRASRGGRGGQGPKNMTWIRRSITVGRADPGSGTTVQSAPPQKLAMSTRPSSGTCRAGLKATKLHERSKSVVHNLSSSFKNNLIYTLVTPHVEFAVSNSGYTSHFFQDT